MSSFPGARVGRVEEGSLDKMSNVKRPVVLDRIKGALFGALIADALAFPSKL